MSIKNLITKLKRLNRRLNGCTIEYDLTFYYRMVSEINRFKIKMKNKTDHQLKQISKDIEESSTNLGANSAYTFKKITLPLITPSFFAGATFSFVRCMTAISAIIFLVSARWNHLTVLILAQTEIMRLGAASVLSFILIIIVMTAILLIRKITGLGQEKVFGA